MNIIIAIDFTDWVGRRWKKGQTPFVSLQLAREWITAGYAIDPDNPPTPQELKALQRKSGIIKKTVKKTKIK